MTSEYPDIPKDTTESVVSPCDDPEINPAFLAEVYEWFQGSDGPYYAAFWRGKAYRMVEYEGGE